jgi:hypothetical protein
VTVIHATRGWAMFPRGCTSSSRRGIAPHAVAKVRTGNLAPRGRGRDDDACTYVPHTHHSPVARQRPAPEPGRRA